LKILFLKCRWAGPVVRIGFNCYHPPVNRPAPKETRGDNPTSQTPFVSTPSSMIAGVFFEQEDKEDKAFREELHRGQGCWPPRTPPAEKSGPHSGRSLRGLFNPAWT